MARKKVLTKGETKLIGDTVRRLLREIGSPTPFKFIFEAVVEIYEDGKIHLSDLNLERSIMYSIGYQEGALFVLENFVLGDRVEEGSR